MGLTFQTVPNLSNRSKVLSLQVVCYWGTWANYRPDGGKFTPEHIDPTLCTHLIYSFAGLDSGNWTIKSLDPWMDLEVQIYQYVKLLHGTVELPEGH